MAQSRISKRYDLKKLLEHKPQEVYDTLIKDGVAPCVAREWSKETERREAMTSRAYNRAVRKHMSSHGRANSHKPYRRILQTIVGKTRDRLGHLHERQFHATKGWRSYRVVE